jgi:AcrR family transcriptional regulator
VTGATSKAEQTRSQIVDAALRLFRERGYQATTMRAIAAEAGVSVGNAYYYFGSKEELVEGFYDQLAAEHVRATEPLLASRTDFGKRLQVALLSWLDVADPYHEFAGQFFATAAQPGNPLSPFSAASHPARDTEIALYRRVLDGSSARPPADLAERLPELLWLYQLGLVLFWVHDTSEALHRSRQLVERTAPMVARLVRLSRLPVFRPVASQAAELAIWLRAEPDQRG